MAALAHSPSKTWRLDHLNPKNSKWLQDNTSETERILKVIISTLEKEDGVSSTKNDELMNLLKEFYGSYRTLAERYDVAAGTLGESERVFSDALPNQTPVSGESSSATPSELKPLVMAPPVSEEVVAPKRLSRLLSRLMSVDDRVVAKPVTEGEDPQKQLSRLKDETARLKGQVLEEKELFNKAKEEISMLKEKIMELGFEKEEDLEKIGLYTDTITHIEYELSKVRNEAKNDLIKLRESEKVNNALNLDLAFTKMRIDELNKNVSEIERGKAESAKEIEALSEQNGLYVMNIRILETRNDELEIDMGKAKTEIRGLKKKLNEIELENISLHEELHETEESKINLQTEIDLLKEARDKLEGQIDTHKSVSVVSNSDSDKAKDLDSLKLEMETKTEMLANAEKTNRERETELETLRKTVKFQEEQNEGLMKEIKKLNEKKSIPEETISNLSKELNFLKETKEKLEKEVEKHSVDKDILQRNLSIKIQGTFDLENKLRDTTAHTERAMNTNAALRDSFMKYDTHREMLVQKHSDLERELSDSNFELETLRERITELEDSETSLKNEILVHVSEKAELESDISEISASNLELESSLSNLKEKFENITIQLSDSEELCEEILARKLSLTEEKDDLLSQVKSMKNIIKNLEDSQKSLEEKLSILSKEKDFNEGKLKELEELVRSKSENHSTALQSHELNFTSFPEKILNLIFEIENLRGKLEESEQSRQSLIEQKQLLIAEKDDIFSQVEEKITNVMNDLEEKHSEIEEKQWVLSWEKYIMQIFEKASLLTVIENLNCNISDITIQNKAEIHNLREKLNEHESDFTEISAKNSRLEGSLSNLIEEFDNVMIKLRDSEELREEIHAQKLALIVEKDDLLSQVRSLRIIKNNLEEKHFSLLKEKDFHKVKAKELKEDLSSKSEDHARVLESHELNLASFQEQISNLNFEIENLRGKLNESEESCQSLIQQKRVLLAENNDLFSQIETITSAMNDLEETQCLLSWEKDTIQIFEKNSLLTRIENLNHVINQITMKYNGELRNSRKKLNEFEASFQSSLDQKLVLISENHQLLNEVSRHISEKNNLLTKIETLNYTINEIKNKNELLIEASKSKVQKPEDQPRSFSDFENNLENPNTNKEIVIFKHQIEKNDLAERFWGYVTKREKLLLQINGTMKLLDLNKKGTTRPRRTSIDGVLFKWIILIKSLLGTSFCSIKTVLEFYANFFSAHESFKPLYGSLDNYSKIKSYAIGGIKMVNGDKKVKIEEPELRVRDENFDKKI